jgi:hypothetical protein
VQAECQRQPTNAAAGDKNGHDAPSCSRLDGMTGGRGQP